MKYIEVISPTFYWSIGIKHSILQKWNKILSFEEWVFKIYDGSYLKTRKILKSNNISEFSFEKYEWVKLEWFTCFEALEYICKKEGVNMNTWRLKTYIKLAFLLFVTHLLIAILWIIIGIKLDDDIARKSIEAYVWEGIWYYIFE